MMDIIETTAQVIELMDEVLGEVDYESRGGNQIGCKDCGGGVTMHLGYCVKQDCMRQKLRAAQSFLKHDHYPTRVVNTLYHD